MSFDDFKQADGGEPLDGLHHATLESGGVLDTRNGIRVKLAWRTLDLEHSWESWHGTSGRAKRFTQEAMVALGVDFSNLKDWEELDAELKAREGSVYMVRVERNGDYLNSYVEGKPQGVQEELIDSSGLPEPAAVPAGDAGDDDIPF